MQSCKSRVALLFFLILFLSCSDGDRMRGLMEHVDSLNQCYASLADDSVMPSVVSWMDRHGTANERMRAHYLLAAVYRDRGQAPESLGELQTAAQCADTTAADCDYHTLSRVHGQMAELFYAQFLPNESLAELDEMERFSRLAHDTLTCIWPSEYRSYIYENMDMRDSSLYYIKKAYDLYQYYGYYNAAVNCSGSLILYLVELGRPEEARKYMTVFEKDANSPLSIQREMYAYVKGKYYQSIGLPDSALMFYEKCMEMASSAGVRESAYKGLYELYSELHQPDSVAKYAVRCYLASNSQYLESNADQIRQSHALYNYSRHQAMAFQKAKEASVLRQRMTVVFSCSVILVLSAFFLAFFAIKKKRLQVEKLTEEYQLRIRQIQDAKAEIEKATFNDYMERQRAELDDGQQKLHDLLGISYGTTPVDVCSNEVYSCFMEAATHPRVKVTQTDWKRLHNLFAEKIPNFRNQLTHGKAISESDMRLCMLIRMHFTVSEICVLLDTYSQYVSNRRCQLLKKFYQIKGKAEDFDRIVSMIN